MKVITILGTRPELIRLCTIIQKLDNLVDHTFVHTGQNYDPNLHDIFFEQLGIRRPDYQWNTTSDTAMGQIGKILTETEALFKRINPDKILILGDTNSGLAAIVAKRMGIPVYHMEAGNRCFDDRVPEEVNRKIIDHASDVLLPYTERSRYNLLKEGISSNRIYVTGNPILEVLNYFKPDIDQSDIHTKLQLVPKKYFLITLHRSENVDIPERLDNFLEAFKSLYEFYHYPVILSLHPRTASQLKKQGKEITQETGIVVCEPFGLFDFIKLEKEAFCVLSDSGTVQEECSIFNVPNVTIRDVTERPETMEVGSNFIAGCDPEIIMQSVKCVTSLSSDWNAPIEYQVENVSNSVVKILMSYKHK